MAKIVAYNFRIEEDRNLYSVGEVLSYSGDLESMLVLEKGDNFKKVNIAETVLIDNYDKVTRNIYKIVECFGPAFTPFEVSCWEAIPALNLEAALHIGINLINSKIRKKNNQNVKVEFYRLPLSHLSTIASIQILQNGNNYIRDVNVIKLTTLEFEVDGAFEVLPSNNNLKTILDKINYEIEYLEKVIITTGGSEETRITGKLQAFYNIKKIVEIEFQKKEKLK